MFRKATEKDIAAVAAIYGRIHDEEEQIRQTGWLRGVYPVEATARNALVRGDLFVYEEDGEVLASAVINKLQVDVYADCTWSCDAPDDKVMVLHTLSVSPDAMHRGIGKRFVEFYEDCARECGCTVVRLDTNEINARARRMYTNLGYTEAGIVPCLFNGIPGVDLVCLDKIL